LLVVSRLSFSLIVGRQLLSLEYSRCKLDNKGVSLHFVVSR